MEFFHSRGEIALNLFKYISKSAIKYNKTMCGYENLLIYYYIDRDITMNGGM
jgi:hypothetical protein